MVTLLIEFCETYSLKKAQELYKNLNMHYNNNENKSNEKIIQKYLKLIENKIKQ